MAAAAARRTVGDEVRERVSSRVASRGPIKHRPKRPIRRPREETTDESSSAESDSWGTETEGTGSAGVKVAGAVPAETARIGAVVAGTKGEASARQVLPPFVIREPGAGTGAQQRKDVLGLGKGGR